MNLILKFSMILLTVFAYFIALKMNKIKYLSKLPVVIISVLIVYTVLSLIKFDISVYQQYNNIILFLLGPAIVALSIPLIKNFNLLKRNYHVILIGIIISTFFAVLSVILIGCLFKLNYNIMVSIIPKSVTLPVAIEITKIINGKIEITILLVMFSGVFGASLGHSILKLIGVKNNLAIGCSLGFISHVLGTAACLERNSFQAAVSTTTLILSCISTAIITPIILKILF
jgi:putative effector of murein hydrolase